jgi:hypothetical protein
MWAALSAVSQHMCELETKQLSTEGVTEGRIVIDGGVRVVNHCDVVVEHLVLVIDDGQVVIVVLRRPVVVVVGCLVCRLIVLRKRTEIVVRLVVLIYRR